MLAGVFEQTAATASKLIMCQCLCRLLSLHKRQVEGAAGGLGRELAHVPTLFLQGKCFAKVAMHRCAADIIVGQFYAAAFVG